jgi:hypothetical protein
MDIDHLNAIELRLSNARARAANSKKPWNWEIEISQIEKELAGEYKFLGIAQPGCQEIDDDKLMDELLS